MEALLIGLMPYLAAFFGSVICGGATIGIVISGVLNTNRARTPAYGVGQKSVTVDT